jgi:hypothetical protein
LTPVIRLSGAKCFRRFPGVNNAGTNKSHTHDGSFYAGDDCFALKSHTVGSVTFINQGELLLSVNTSAL